MIALLTPSKVSHSLARSYNELFANGLDALIIRLPGSPKSCYEELIAAIEPQWRHRLLIDDYFDLIEVASIGGVHLNKEKRGSFPLTSYKELRISTSAHSLEELESLPFVPQFALLSPVYDSISKEGYKANVPLHECKKRLPQLPFPVLALGGMTPEKAKEVLAYGFSGAAVLGYMEGAEELLLERFLAFPRTEALTVAGLDPSTGAGMTADILNMEHLGIFPLSVATIGTVQHEEEFKEMCPAPPLEYTLKAIRHLLHLHKPIASKIALTEQISDVLDIARELRSCGVKQIVWDPVIKPTQGDIALHATPDQTLVKQVASCVDLITPNLPEAEALFGSATPEDVQRKAKELGVSVLLKGGHDERSKYCSTDILFMPDGSRYSSSIPKAPSTKHGTGCALSSAITTYLARGFTMPMACHLGQQYIEALLHSSDRLFMERNDRMLLRKERALQSTSLMFITDAADCRGVLSQAEAALKGGVRWIQLRMKQADHELLTDTARKLKELMSAYEGTTLIIDDDIEAVLESGADGVHLGWTDSSIGLARLRLGANRIIGGTCNTLEDVRKRALEGVDYIGLGPWHFTTTKRNLSPVISPEEMKQITMDNLSRCNIPLFVIGGITEDDIESLGKYPIAGVALSGVINQAKEATTKAFHLMTLCNNRFKRNF